MLSRKLGEHLQYDANLEAETETRRQDDSGSTESKTVASIGLKVAHGCGRQFEAR